MDGFGPASSSASLINKHATCPIAWLDGQVLVGYSSSQSDDAVWVRLLYEAERHSSRPNGDERYCTAGLMPPDGRTSNLLA